MNLRERIELVKEIAKRNERRIAEWKARKEKGNMKKITGVLVDVNAGTIVKATIEKSLEGYYAALNCSLIDITSRTIGGRRFLVVCDDEGLLKNDAQLSAIAPSGEVMFVGNLFIAKSDGEDDLESLSDEECAHIIRNSVKVCTGRHQKPYPVLCNIGY